jgi:hypothetical protein
MERNQQAQSLKYMGKQDLNAWHIFENKTHLVKARAAASVGVFLRQFVHHNRMSRRKNNLPEFNMES